MPIDSPAIRWLDDHLLLLDQRHLPSRTEWLAIHDAAGAAGAIRDMAVRGAPAIGITAAYGLALEALGLGRRASLETLRPALETLAASRPTAVNLFWAWSACSGSAPTWKARPWAAAWPAKRRAFTRTTRPPICAWANWAPPCCPTTPASIPTATPARWPPAATAPPWASSAPPGAAAICAR